jgi:hypothetical protein
MKGQVILPVEITNFCWPSREKFSLLSMWAELRTNGIKD